MPSGWGSGDESYNSWQAVLAASLSLVERVAAAAQAVGIETALIGAAALAAHKHVRATLDVDLATSVDPYTKLRELEAALRAHGLRTTLRLPDEDDPRLPRSRRGDVPRAAVAAASERAYRQSGR